MYGGASAARHHRHKYRAVVIVVGGYGRTIAYRDSLLRTQTVLVICIRYCVCAAARAACYARQLLPFP